MEIENVSLKIEGLPPPAPTLINALSCCNKENLAILCDFNHVIVLNAQTKKDLPVFHISKTLTIPRGESLECTSWSPDGQLLVVAGRKLHLFNAVDNFEEIGVFSLHYACKDISVGWKKDADLDKYMIALAGPNGVEIYSCTMDTDRCFVMSEDIVALHVDLPIALLKYSSNSQYLGVAAMDGHFGIWKVKDQMEEHKDFWFLHLRTLRITSIEFSDDARKVAVSCWDGSFHVFQSIEGNDKFQWKTVKYNVNCPVEKVTGTLPGTLVCWSHQDRFFSLSNPTAKGTVVYVYCVESASVKQITVCAGSDYIKGITVIKIDGKEYLVYFTKNRKLGLINITPNLQMVHSSQEDWETLMENNVGKVLYNNTITSPVLSVEYKGLHSVKGFENDNAKYTGSSDVNTSSEDIMKLNAFETNSAKYTRSSDGNASSKDIMKLNIVLPKKLVNISQQMTHRKTEIDRHTAKMGYPNYEVLLSSNAVVFLSALAAHVYLFASKKWKSIVFKTKVVKATLCSGDWLVYVTSGRTICAYNLINGCMKKYQPPINNSLDDVILVASATHCLCVLLDLNGHGNGHTVQIEFSEDMKVKRESVCLPFHAKNTEHSNTEVMLVGSLVVFHQCKTQSHTVYHHYHVLIPGLGLHKHFQPAEPMDFTKFCQTYSEKLYHLHNLVKND